MATDFSDNYLFRAAGCSNAYFFIKNAICLSWETFVTVWEIDHENVKTWAWKMRTETFCF